MFLSEKSGDNVMKKHLSFFVCLNTSFLRSKLLLYEAILSRSAIQMNHRKKTSDANITECYICMEA